MKGQRYDFGAFQWASFRLKRRELHSLLRRLDNGNSVLLTGGRKLGKTVLLQQVQEELEERGPGAGQVMLPVYQDLQIFSQRPTASTLFGTLSQKLANAAAKMLRNLTLSASCPPPPADWKNDPSAEFVDYLNSVLDDLDRTVGAVHLVCLLDECEALLGSSESHLLLDNLRALTGPSTRTRVQIVATGFRDLKDFRDPRSNTSPFANVFMFMQLGLLAPDEFGELIGPLLMSFPAAEQNQLSERILAVTGCHPCVIQTLCGYLLEATGSLEERFEAASSQAMERLRGPVFSSWVNSFRPEDHELFKRLLSGDAVPKADTTSEEFLLYCGVAAAENGILRAPCGLFNKWYKDFTGVATTRVTPKVKVLKGEEGGAGVPGIKIPRAVENAYKANKLAVFVGSGLSLGRDVVGSFPSWGEIPLRLLDACERYEALPDKVIALKRGIFDSVLSLEQMLSELDALLAVLKENYRTAINDIFRPKEARPGAAHEAVMKLNVQAILTTNYDLLLEMADTSRRWQSYTWKDATKALADLRDDRAVLLKVHGSAEHHDTVVMSRAEYNQVQADSSYKEVLKFLLQDNLFLFVGYGMNDPLDLDRMLRGNSNSFREAARRHYVLLKQATQQDIERLDREYKVTVIPYTEHEQVTQFLSELAKVKTAR